MSQRARRFVRAAAAIFSVAAIGALGFAGYELSAFDASMRYVRAVPLRAVSRSGASDVIARGKQLADSVGACTSSNCHGADLGGGRILKMGPLAAITAPNLSSSRLASYSDGELARLLRFGIKKDGRSVLMMPVQNFAWLPDGDIDAIVSWLRSVPPVVRVTSESTVTALGKIMDRRNRVVFDVARYIQEHPPRFAAAPAPDANYGRFVAEACTMCHGAHLSGGRIPGAPSSLPMPLNLTPDASGLLAWSYEDFDRLLTTGVRRNGKRLDPFMPYEAFAKYDSVQKQALWSYLRSLPARSLGER